MRQYIVKHWRRCFQEASQTTKQGYMREEVFTAAGLLDWSYSSVYKQVFLICHVPGPVLGARVLQSRGRGIYAQAPHEIFDEQ